MDYDRFQLAAICDRLIYQHEQIFDIHDAVQLLQIIPKKRGAFFSFVLNYKQSDRSAEGYAAGVGNVEFGSDKQTKTYDTDAKSITRAGQWKLRWILTRTTQQIIIEQVMADGDDGRSALMLYSRQGQPIEMFLRTNRTFTIWRFYLEVPSWKLWKYPVMYSWTADTSATI